jgi:SNF family Na+-dependent transporter
MVSDEDLDKLTVIVTAAGLAIGFVFVWSALALTNGGFTTVFVVWLCIAIALGIIAGKVMKWVMGR